MQSQTPSSSRQTISWCVSLPLVLSSIPAHPPPPKEFGIDIVGEDNKTIIHHKVAARVVCVITEQDAQAAARAEQHQPGPSMVSLSARTPAAATSSNAAFDFAAAQGAPGQPQRRGVMRQQGLGALDGMCGNMRAPGKGSLSFDYILTRLQDELQKSRETGADLNSLSGMVNKIHEALSGASVSSCLLALYANFRLTHASPRIFLNTPN